MAQDESQPNDYQAALLHWQLTEERMDRFRAEMTTMWMGSDRITADLGIFVLKSLIVINGAAAIALLALLGALNHEFRPDQTLIDAIAPSLREFGRGVLLAFIAAVVGYFYQYCLTGHQHRHRVLVDQDGEKADRTELVAKRFWRAAAVLILLCVAISIASFVSFARGLHIASAALGG